MENRPGGDEPVRDTAIIQSEASHGANPGTEPDCRQITVSSLPGGMCPATTNSITKKRSRSENADKEASAVDSAYVTMARSISTTDSARDENNIP